MLNNMGNCKCQCECEWCRWGKLVWRLIADHPGGIRLDELAELANLPPYVVFTILEDLRNYDIVRREPRTGRWCPEMSPDW